MTPTQYKFIPLLFEHIEERGYGIITRENWQELTGSRFPKEGQCHYIKEYDKTLQVLNADLQRNELSVGYML